MHIPDGVVDPAVMAGAGAAFIVAVVWAGRQVRRGNPRWGLALAGAGAVLVGHLADVPLAGAHMGHLVGGTLLAVALGPALAVVGVLAGYGGYRAVLALARRASAGQHPASTAVAAGVGAWVSVVASAAVLAGLGGAAPSALMPYYTSWGVLEGVVTGGAVAVGLAWSGQVARLRGVEPGPRAVRARDGEVAALA